MNLGQVRLLKPGEPHLAQADESGAGGVVHTCGTLPNRGPQVKPAITTHTQAEG